ncbi:MAG: CoA-binding protein [Bacteroidales bacterium]|nr:CoA-binding protein [Bacteroidales bacterium]
MSLNTLVIGASPKPERYSFKAINMLKKYGHTVKAIGLKEIMIGDIKINKGLPDFNNIDTVTLYLGPKNQMEYYNYIMEMNPRRIIFNPGSYNPDLIGMAEEKGIEVIEACTLVMLSTGQFEEY